MEWKPINTMTTTRMWGYEVAIGYFCTGIHDAFERLAGECTTRDNAKYVVATAVQASLSLGILPRLIEVLRDRWAILILATENGLLFWHSDRKLQINVYPGDMAVPGYSFSDEYLRLVEKGELQ